MLREIGLGHRAFALVLAAAMGVVTSPARAQTDEQRAAARSLATEGATAFNEGRWKDSVDLFTRAESLVHATPHLLFLARAHEKLGQLVKAREAYLKIMKESLPPNAPQAFRDARAAAEQELRAVEPRIASLTVKVQGPADNAEVSVSVDGTPIASVLIGVAQPIDPGEHRIEAVASGFRARPEMVRLADGERRAVTLTLVSDPTAALAKQGPSDAPASTSPPQVLPAPSTTTPAAAPASDSTSSGLRIGSYVAFGVGVVGLGVGTYFALDSRSKRADADSAYDDCVAADDCRENDPSARRTAKLDDDARSSLTLSIIGLSAGAVGLGVGTALFLSSSGKSEEGSPAALSIRPFVGLGHAGVNGRF